MTRRLPPDPEGQNDDRAAWARTALSAFQRKTGAEDKDAVADLLCDLMHLADRSGGDFEAELVRARANYEGETACDPGEVLRDRGSLSSDAGPVILRRPFVILRPR